VSKRLYLPGPYTRGPAALDPSRTHYLKSVLRLRDGAAVLLFDGAGQTASATARHSGRDLMLEIEAVHPPEAAPAPRIHLAWGLLKSKAQEQLLRKATELGATDLWPVYTDHTHEPRKALPAANDARAHAVIASAAEQCGQNWLPALHPGRDLRDLLAALPATARLAMDQHGSDWPHALPQTDTLLLVGPEGGWSDAERAAFDAADVGRVQLGPLVLRAETAPLVALSHLRAWWSFRS
jgi:16S rRNA (uracil1498-N3)-methyltransferase